MKKTRLKRKSRSEIRKLQDELWEECRRVVFLRDNKDGNIDCYTCNAKDLQGSNRQLGHMWAKASLSAILKYDIRILRWQCSRCNIWMGGMGAVFFEKLQREIGGLKMKELIELKNNPPMILASEYYKTLLENYKNLPFPNK